MDKHRVQRDWNTMTKIQRVVVGLLILLILIPADAVRAWTLSRQVLLPEGQPAAGAKVAAHIMRSERNFDESPYAEFDTVTSANGTFSVQRDAEYQYGYIVVDAPGCAPMFSSFRFDKDKTYAAAKPLRLTRAYVLHGKTVDATGVAAGNAQISVNELNAQLDAARTISLSPPEAPTGWLSSRLDFMDDAAAMQAFTTQSQSDGTFSLRGIDMEHPQGEFTSVGLIARVETEKTSLGGAGHIEVATSDGTTSQKDSAFVLALQPTTTVAGKIIDNATGQPLSGVKLQLRVSYNVLPQETISDAAGAFRFDVAPSTLTSFLASYGVFSDRLELTADTPDFASAEVVLLETQRRSGWKIWSGPEKYRQSPLPFHNFLDDLKPIKNLTLKMRPLVSVEGRVLDFDSRRAPTLSMIADARCEEASAQYKQIGYATGVKVRPDGSFSMRAPQGLCTFSFRGQYLTMPREEKRSHNTNSIEMVTAYDTSSEKFLKASSPETLTFVVQKTPGWPLRFHSDNAQGLKNCKVEFRDKSGKSIQTQELLSQNDKDAFDHDADLFFPALSWGEALEMRVFRNDKEVLRWTPIIANPVHWPLSFAVP